VPLGEGVVLDPFMGSGSTIAAAEALGISSIGVERLEQYFQIAKVAIPKLRAIEVAKVDARVGTKTSQGMLFTP
jgi:site-specific DNA-methyltransferase (adenine-specific)